MNAPNRFRLTTIFLALMLSWFALSTIFAEIFTPRKQIVSQDLQLPDQVQYGFLAQMAATAAPLRGDLLANLALARAATVLNAGSASTSQERELVMYTIEHALTISPHSSDMWLLLAILQYKAGKGDSVADLLNMSYLTSTADVNLIPARLVLVAASAATSDSELKDLVRGDIRLILTRRPDLRPAIVNAYRHGSADGQSYIDKTVKSLDPAFAAALQ